MNVNKQEFISELKESLEGRVPNRIVRENIQYYRTYLSNEAEESNRTEQEVIEELGSPRLIARTIVDAYEAEYGPYEGQDSGFYEEKGRDIRDTDNYNNQIRFNSCFPIALVIILFVFLVLLTVFKLIFSLPGIVICLIALVIYLYFSGRRRN